MSEKNHPDANRLRAMAVRFREGRMTADERAACGVALTILGRDLTIADMPDAADLAHRAAREWLPDNVRLSSEGQES